MKKYSLLAVLLFFLWLTGNTQEVFGVVGKISTNYNNYLVFKAYDTRSCLLDYKSSIYVNDRNQIIIGDTTCKGSWPCYQVVYKDTIRLIEKSMFEDKKKIDGEIKTILARQPFLNDRFQWAIKQKEILKNQIDRELREAALKDSLLYVEEEKENLRKIDSLKTQIDKHLSSYRLKNWVLWDWSWFYPNEYSSFADVYVEVINPFPKKIKYIWFTLKAFNAVDDLIKNGISGASSVTVKGIGPIDYSDRATYNFESVFYSKVINSMMLSQIKIQFFDGTVKVINSPHKILIEE